MKNDRISRAHPLTGRWKKLTPVPQTSSLYMAECSECGKLTYVGNYCMECGARNEGEDE